MPVNGSSVFGKAVGNVQECVSLQGSRALEWQLLTNDKIISPRKVVRIESCNTRDWESLTSQQR
jgi:hypothetical protein